MAREKENVLLNFEGYWREGNERDLPPSGGVYCVYEARMTLATGKLTPLKLLFVGSSGNVRKQVVDHAKQGEWRKHLGRDHHICYSFAPVPAEKRKYVEAALVHAHQPPVNVLFKDIFPYDRVHLLISGKVGLLKPFVTVRKKV